MTYAEWLQAEGYAASTVRVSLAALTQLERGERKPTLRSHAQRVLLAAEGGAEFSERIVKLCRELAAEKGRSSPRKSRAKSQRQAERRALPLTVEEQRALERTFKLAGTLQNRQGRSALVLRVMLATGLRVHDTVPIRWAQIEAAQREGGRLRLRAKGGVERIIPLDGSDAWDALIGCWRRDRESFKSATIGEWLCPGSKTANDAGGAAYAALRDELQRFALNAGLGETRRVHPHLLRRTAIVEALRATGDVERARSFAGHSTSRTTERYLADARPDDVAEIQRAIAKRREEEES
jgi:integrase